jgi:uncharacterized protein (DUF924 family)
MSAPSYEDVLSFWFGPVDGLGRAADEHARRWFLPDDGFDRQIRDQFEGMHADIMAGRREQWLDEPRGCLASIIVLDQLSRNMFRGTPRAFSADDRARAAAQGGVAGGHDRRLPPFQRWFLYLPFMHSEELPDQERSVALFSALAAEVPADARAPLLEAASFAERHREIVARFGRFPHRNAVLGRASTAEEIEFLKQPQAARQLFLTGGLGLWMVSAEETPPTATSLGSVTETA